MLSGLVLGQDPGTVLRGERSPRRLGSRINTIRNRWFRACGFNMITSDPRPHFRSPHKTRGVSHQPDREGTEARVSASPACLSGPSPCVPPYLFRPKPLQTEWAVGLEGTPPGGA